MLAAVEPLGKELPVDLFLSIKEDNATRGIQNYCFKCENIAEVAPTLKKQWTCDKASEIFFARKGAGEITCKCLRAGKSYGKSDPLSHAV